LRERQKVINYISDNEIYYHHNLTTLFFYRTILQPTGSDLWEQTKEGNS